MYKEIEKKPYWESDSFVFKATEVPKHVTMRLFESLKTVING